MIRAESSYVVGERSGNRNPWESIVWVVEIGTRNPLIVFIEIVGIDGKKTLQTQVQPRVVVIRWPGLIPIIFVGIEAEIHVDVFAVKQGRSKPPNKQDLTECVERTIAH